MTSSPTAPASERSFPKPEFTGAEAGLLEFPSSKSRTYNYFTRQSCGPPCTRT